MSGILNIYQAYLQNVYILLTELFPFDYKMSFILPDRSRYYYDMMGHVNIDAGMAASLNDVHNEQLFNGIF